MQQLQQGFSNAGSAGATGEVSAPSNTPNAPNTADNGIGTGGSAPPNEGLYGQYQAQALDAFNKAQTAIQQRRSGIYQSYGFNQDGSVDGNNSVGAYQQMKHSQALELDAARNQALERHLGGHGLGAQVAEAPRFQEAVDEASLGNSYLGALDANSGELSGAQSQYQQALIDARRLQIEDDIANGRYTTPGTGGDGGDGGGDGAGSTGNVQSSPGGLNGLNPIGKRAAEAAARLVKTPAAKPAAKQTAKKVTANKTGASANKKQGIYSIH